MQNQERVDLNGSGARATPGGDDQLRALLGSLGGDVNALLRSAWRVVLVQLQTLHLYAVGSFFTALFYVSVFIATVAVTIAAAVMAVRGASVLIAHWMPIPGAAELCAGTLAITGVVGGCLALRAWLGRRIARTTARRLKALGALGGAAPSSGSTAEGSP